MLHTSIHVWGDLSFTAGAVDEELDEIEKGRVSVLLVCLNPLIHHSLKHAHMLCILLYFLFLNVFLLQLRIKIILLLLLLLNTIYLIIIIQVILGYNP